ncbi:MAG TPA: signal peptidase I, partial [Ilumatobacteraceae bacterium]
MPGDDWWTQAVDQFGLDTTMHPARGRETAPVDDLLGLDETVPTPVPKRRRRRRAGLDWLIIAVASLGAAFLLRMFVVQQFAVDGESMLGTLHSGDRVIVNKLSYEFHDPRRGDIVVLKDVKASLEVRDLIKRVIGLPGETIEYRDCELFINGRRFTEPYLDPQLVQADHCGESQRPT